jgi:hypothetical protein
MFKEPSNAIALTIIGTLSAILLGAGMPLIAAFILGLGISYVLIINLWPL